MSAIVIDIPDDCVAALAGCCCDVSITQPDPAIATTLGLFGEEMVGGCCRSNCDNAIDHCGDVPGTHPCWECINLVNFETPGLGIKLHCGARDITSEATWLIEFVSATEGSFLSSPGVPATPTITITDPTDPNTTVKYSGIIGRSGVYSYGTFRATATYLGNEYVLEYAYSQLLDEHLGTCTESC